MHHTPQEDAIVTGKLAEAYKLTSQACAKLSEARSLPGLEGHTEREQAVDATSHLWDTRNLLTIILEKRGIKVY